MSDAASKTICVDLLREWSAKAETDYLKADTARKRLGYALDRMPDKTSAAWWEGSATLGQLTEKTRQLKQDLEALEDELWRILYDDQASKTLCIGAHGGGGA